MKLSKLILCGSAAIALASTARAADVVIDLTGSSAFRAAIVAAIQAAYTPGYTVAYTGSALNSGNQQLFRGDFPGIALSGGDKTVIRTTWSGSVEGVTDVAGGLPATGDFIPTTATTTVPPGTLFAGTRVPSVAKITLSDVYQLTTPVVSPTLTDEQVGVVNFLWVANRLSTLTNVTTQVANVLLTNGTIAKSQFTGVAGDASKTVYLTGRYNGSGTRAVQLAEAGYGVFNSVNQYAAGISAVQGTITSLRLWPNLVQGPITGGTNDATTGNGGYTSGGSIRDIVGCTPAATVSLLNPNGTAAGTVAGSDVDVVGVLGTSDAANASAAGRIALTYNGATFSQAAVQNGSYTLWSYQHLMFKGPLTAQETTVKNAIVTGLPAQLLASPNLGTRLTDMQVVRNTDGGLVSP